MSLTEKVSNYILSSADGDIKRELKKLIDSGAYKINPDNVPARYAYDPAGTGFINAFRGVLAESKDPKLLELSEGQLCRDLQALSGAPVEDPSQGSSRSRVMAPMCYGTEALSKEDLEAWYNWRKYSKDQASISQSLRFIVNYHSKNSNKFSEVSLLENLYVILPANLISQVMVMVDKGSSLQEVFDYCSCTHEPLMTDEMIRDKVETMLNSAKDPMQAINDLLPLLSKASGSKAEIDKALIQETRRFLKRLGGEPLMALIDAHVQHQKDRSFISFLTLLNDHFPAQIREAGKRKKVNNVIEDHQGTDKLARAVEQLDKKMSANLLAMHNLTTPPQPHPAGARPKGPAPSGQSVVCYRCGESGHIQRNCQSSPLGPPSRPTPKGPLPGAQGTLRYLDALCSIHKGKQHINANCFVQASLPCPVPNHQGHYANQCRRPNDNRSPISTASPSRPGKPWPQGGQRGQPPMALSSPPPFGLANHAYSLGSPQGSNLPAQGQQGVGNMFMGQGFNQGQFPWGNVAAPAAAGQFNPPQAGQPAQPGPADPTGQLSALEAKFNELSTILGSLKN